MKRVGVYLGTMLLCMLLLTACKPSVPRQYIQPDDMEDIHYDYFVSQGMAQIPGDGSEDYRRDLYFNTVLNKYDVSRADFDSSLVYYYTRADKLAKIFRNVQERMNEDALNMGTPEGEVERYMTQSLTGDTANIWQQEHYAMLVPYGPYNQIQFVQKADTSYHAGDSFMLSFKSDFLYQGGTKDAVCYLAVRYANDSIASSVVHFSTSGISQLRIGECSERVKEVSGFFYLGEGFVKSADLKMLFLTNIQLIRFHKKETAKAEQPAPEALKADTMEVVPDSLRPRRHKLGERPMEQPTATAIPIQRN